MEIDAPSKSEMLTLAMKGNNPVATIIFAHEIAQETNSSVIGVLRDQGIKPQALVKVTRMIPRVLQGINPRK